jgi:O-succinylbenzoic acid--CoA ligase
LPHAKIWVGDDAAVPKKSGEKGRIWIQAESLFSGYYPSKRAAGPFGTEDSVVMDDKGRVRPLGRLDRVIISGGEKINPEEVEKQIRATRLVEDIRVVGLPDAEWGERVTAIYIGPLRTETELHAALAGRLSAYAIPKIWMHSEQPIVKTDKF